MIDGLTIQERQDKMTEFTGGLMTSAVAQLDKCKDRIWHTVYCCILLYGVTVATYLKCIRFNEYLITILSLVILLSIYIIGYRYINRLNKSILEHRKYITKIYMQHKEECEAIGLDPDQTKVDDSFFNTSFKSAILIGLGLSLLIVLGEINFFIK